MLIDSHVHVGQFFNSYFSAEYIFDFTKKCGINQFVVSSTSACEDNIEKVIAELSHLCEIGGTNILPCLWLTETMIHSPKFNSYFECGVSWRCLKIHPALHPEQWESRSQQISTVISLARLLHIPLLIHTGYDATCRSDKYDKEIASNPDVNFILAHGRPLDATSKSLISYTNTYVDTAFMPIEDIIHLVNIGYGDRILWGSDFPITQFYYQNTNPVNYYKELLEDLRRSIDSHEFLNITYYNAKRIFDL